VATARPVSTATNCSGAIRRASPAAVVEANPGTGHNPCPAASARTRSNPTRKSSPANCAAAIPTNNCPAEHPRSRVLTGPTAASNPATTPNRPTSSVTATIPAYAVNDASDPPTRTPAARVRRPRKLPTR